MLWAFFFCVFLFLAPGFWLAICFVFGCRGGGGEGRVLERCCWMAAKGLDLNWGCDRTAASCFVSCTLQKQNQEFKAENLQESWWNEMVLIVVTVWYGHQNCNSWANRAKRPCNSTLYQGTPHHYKSMQTADMSISQILSSTTHVGSL